MLWEPLLGGGGDGVSINNITDIYGTIAGGFSNQVGDNNGTTDDRGYGTIAGGSGNNAKGEYSTIGGGQGNHANNMQSIIAGGKNNVIDGDYGSIIGGNYNEIKRNISRGGSDYGTIGGGFENKIVLSPGYFLVPTIEDIPSTAIMPQYCSILGGYQNCAHGHYSSIGGGVLNHAVGVYSTIPGGSNLVAWDHQTVIGRFNRQPSDTKFPNERHNISNWGAPTLGSPTYPANREYPIFVVGNGKTGNGNQTNAFEVSDFGYSTVYDNLAKHHSAIQPNPVDEPFYGTTYQDNVLIAWADVPGAIGTNVLRSSFGVESVVYTPGANFFTVTLKNTHSDSDPNQNVGIDQASITATISTSFEATNVHCNTIVVSQIQSNVFHVFTLDNCVKTNLPFMFKVVGRRLQ